MPLDGVSFEIVILLFYIAMIVRAREKHPFSRGCSFISIILDAKHEKLIGHNQDFFPCLYSKLSSYSTLGCQINEQTRLALSDFSPPYLHFFHPFHLFQAYSLKIYSFFPSPYLFIRAYIKYPPQSFIWVPVYLALLV